MKPIAWTDGKFCLSFAESDVCPIPLYTAPRELSDEEKAVLKEIIRISDRKHPLWDKAKEFLK